MGKIKEAIKQVFKAADPIPADAIILEVGSKVKLAGGDKLGLYGVITNIDDKDDGDIEITRYGVDGETIADVFLLAIKDKNYLQPN